MPLRSASALLLAVALAAAALLPAAAAASGPASRPSAARFVLQVAAADSAGAPLQGALAAAPAPEAALPMPAAAPLLAAPAAEPVPDLLAAASPDGTAPAAEEGLEEQYRLSPEQAELLRELYDNPADPQAAIQARLACLSGRARAACSERAQRAALMCRHS